MTNANDTLIAAAEAALKPYKSEDATIGEVAAALVTVAGNEYRGVSIEAPCGIGFCGEHSAIAAMVTAAEYQIARIVAVWRNGDGSIDVVPPCGRCREFIQAITPDNLDTEVVLGREHTVQLRDLLPHHEWPQWRSP